jgi:hypothetical protein
MEEGPLPAIGWVGLAQPLWTGERGPGQRDSTR